MKIKIKDKATMIDMLLKTHINHKIVKSSLSVTALNNRDNIDFINYIINKDVVDDIVNNIKNKNMFNKRLYIYDIKLLFDYLNLSKDETLISLSIKYNISKQNLNNKIKRYNIYLNKIEDCFDDLKMIVEKLEL